MLREKQYVYSSRTTEEGLKILNQLKQQRGISWDELITDAVCAHYGLDKSALMLPKAERPKKEPKLKVQKPKAGKKAKAKAAGKPEVAPEQTTEAEAPEQVLVS